ncbi:MAG: prolyl-tRNA synthetase associated domain-containing protein [Bacteroidia bacterium]
MEKVLEHLTALEVEFSLTTHAPLMTMEEALPIWEELGGAFCKNLFFRNNKGNQHYLVILTHEKLLDVKRLEKELKQGRLSFASAERMAKHLGLSPGSVSPFGLIHDETQHVIVFLDQDLKQFEKVNFHPNDNTATLTLSYTDFIRFLEERGNVYSFIEM